MTPLPHVIRDESLARIGLVGHFLAISPQLLYGGKSMLTLVSLMLHDWWAACAENEMNQTLGLRRIYVLEFPRTSGLTGGLISLSRRRSSHPWCLPPR
jgi:hypothetical protein